MGGSVPVATPDSIHGTFFELQLLMPRLSFMIKLRSRLGLYEPTHRNVNKLRKGSYSQANRFTFPSTRFTLRLLYGCVG